MREKILIPFLIKDEVVEILKAIETESNKCSQNIFNGKTQHRF